MPKAILPDPRSVKNKFVSVVMAVPLLLLGMVSAGQAAVVFQDSFTNFTMGAQWQPYGAGAPDLLVGIVGGGSDGSCLRMGSSAGAAGEVVGIQTTSSFPIAGVRVVRVIARVRPLNQTASGGGASSDASAGIAVIGASGTFARASASANRGINPTWADFYGDSEGSANSASVAYVSFPPNDPAGGAEAFRTFVIEVRTNGTSLTTLSSTGDPLAVTPFNVFNPNLTLAAFSNSVSIALFQQLSDATQTAPEVTFGEVDSVKIEIEGDMVTLLDDPFSPPGAGPGSNWKPAGNGFPNVVCDRATVDGHDGLRMGTVDTTGPAYGIQLVNPLLVPADATGLDIDFLVQPRNGGAYDARLVMDVLGTNYSLAASFNEFFPGGGVRRVVTLGSGGGGAFSQSSGEYAFGPNNFYHALVSVRPTGTTVAFKSEDLSTVLATFSVAQLTLANLAGKSVQLSILQADRDHPEAYIGSPECLADRLTVKLSMAAPQPLIISIHEGGNVIDDSKPLGAARNGANHGATWARSDTDSGAVTRSGVMQFSAAATNQITLAADADFNSATGTILFWMRSAGTTGEGIDGAALFDRLPTDVNGPSGALLAQTDAGNLLFEAASGAGVAGFPNEVSARINLDGTHFGYRMRTSDQSGAVYGIQLATPLAIIPGETQLSLDLLVQNRGGGQFPARLMLKGGAGGSKSLTATLYEFAPGITRQFVVSGVGGSGAFSQASPDYTQSPYNFYHVKLAIGSTGTTIDLLTEDMSTVLATFTVPELTVADLSGTNLQVYILQAASSSAGSTESLVGHLTVTSATTGDLLNDAFEPPAAGPGPNWVAASGGGVASQFQSVRTVNDNRWHLIALTYDQSPSGACSLFIDGTQDGSHSNGSAWAWSAQRQIELGRSHDMHWRAYNGLLDDFRIYNRVLTGPEIAQVASTGALVDDAALKVRFNFNSPPSGYTLTWPGTGTLEGATDLSSPVTWTPLPNSHSPYFVRPGDAPLLFYRAVGQ